MVTDRWSFSAGRQLLLDGNTESEEPKIIILDGVTVEDP
jgi:hypothetical protein